MNDKTDEQKAKELEAILDKYTRKQLMAMLKALTQK